MGKKRIIKKTGSEDAARGRGAKKLPRKKLEKGVLYVQSTYNNTKILLTDVKGNAICSASSGGLGFKGAKKGTPFAAAQAGEVLAEKATQLGVKEIDVIVKGVGAGRESAIRSFVTCGATIKSIQDRTPTPFNGPTPRKPRRV